MARITGPWKDLSGTNKIRFHIDYTESISGTKNTLTVKMVVETKWKIDGTWKCELAIDGSNIASQSVRILHGSYTSGGSTTVLTGTKTIEYGGSKTIKLKASMPGMDYYHEPIGPSSTLTKGLVFEKSVSLTSTITNKLPEKPTMYCDNAPHNSKYIAEATLNIGVNEGVDADGDKLTYQMFAEAKQPGESSFKTMGDANSCIFSSDSSRGVLFPITKYKRGTQFKVWARLKDGHGYSPISNVWTNIYRNQIPNKVTSISPDGGMYNTASFTITWTKATDPDGTTVSYNLYLSKNGGSYELIKEKTSSASHTQDISKDSDGTTYKYMVKAWDGLCESEATYSGLFRKNTKPTKPSQIFPNKGYYLGEVDLSWNRSTDPDGNGIKEYLVYINDTKIGSTTDTKYKWTIPTSDRDDIAYTVGVAATDNDGLTGDKGYATGPFYRAKPPQPPIWNDLDEDFFETDIPLSWKSVESNGAGVVYELSVKWTGSDWIVWREDYKLTSFKFNLDALARGTELQFRLKAKNTFEQESGYSYSKTYYKNRIPLSPKIFYPIIGETVHSKNPRICFKIESEPDGQNQVVYIRINGSTYNSASHSSMFSNGGKSLKKAQSLVFTSPELSSGSYIVTMYVSDGLISSNSIEHVIFVEASSLHVTKGELIKTDIFYNIRNELDTVRKAYGLKNYNYSIEPTKNALIKSNITSEMIESAKAVRTVINDFDSDNSYKITTSFDSVTKGELIYASTMNQLIDVIKNT